MADAVDRVIGHPIRRRLIVALWHSSEPLSARRFHSEYFDDETTLGTLSYHLGVLERDGIAEPVRSHGEGSLERPVVLGGPNSSRAVVRLGLS